MKALGLRTCKADMTAHGGFVWPKSGPVEAPDWKPTPECGNGLHALLWGEGDCGLLNWRSDAVWQIVEFDNWVDLGGKVKFPRCKVVHTGDRPSATRYLWEHGGSRYRIVGLAGVWGNYSTLTAGYGSTLTAGDGSTLSAGDYSTLSAGDYSTLTAGDGSTLTAGDRSTLTAGDRSTLTGGDCSTLTAGYYSTLTGGDYSTLTAGDYSTLTWRIWDGYYYRIHTTYVGEDGIKPNVAYKWGDGKAVEA